MINHKIDDSTDKAICINNLSVEFDGISILNNISLEINKGDFFGIIGPNGGGKTTLIKTIVGINPFFKGNICIYNKFENKKIGYMPQISTSKRNFPISVNEVVLSGMLDSTFHLFHKYSKIEKQKSIQLLTKLGIDKLHNRNVSELSGGEFQKMLLARALAADPDILILDEPTASVDLISRNQIFSLLKMINKNITIIIVSHDLDAISAYTNKIAFIDKSLIYYKKTDSLFYKETFSKNKNNITKTTFINELFLKENK